ncbi:MAG TPA: glutathione S-transferase family protein [Candidatus Kryptonia bacterium]|nr:glutathione S-transferase family protein [Candidatus Kryptonia bacterium]
MIRLAQFAVSPYCDKVRRILRYKKLPFEIHEWPLAEVGSIRDKNPTGKLPFIEIDGTVIPDSTNIALEIERRHPTPALIPSDPAQRALVLALEDWADESLYFYEMTTRFGDADFDANVGKLMAGAPKEMIDAMSPMLREMFKQTTTTQGIGRKSADQLAGDLDRLFGAIEDLQRASGFVVGNSLTLADIAICCQAECIGDSTVGKQVLAKRPALAAYFKRVDELTKADRV